MVSVRQVTGSGGRALCLSSAKHAKLGPRRTYDLIPNFARGFSCRKQSSGSPQTEPPKCRHRYSEINSRFRPKALPTLRPGRHTHRIRAPLTPASWIKASSECNLPWPGNRVVSARRIGRLHWWRGRGDHPSGDLRLLRRSPRARCLIKKISLHH